MKKLVALLLACMMMLSVMGSALADDSKVEVTVGSAMAWETLTPFRTARIWAIIYSRMLYDSLAWRTADGVLNPVAAKSWEVEEDGVTWNVELFDYIYDSAGNHITADDIVWYMEEMKAQALKPPFGQVESIEKTGDYTLKIVMKQDIFGNFENVLCHTFVVSKAAYEADPDGFVSKVVSSAPYKVTDFVSGSHIILEKRDDYWQKPELIPAALANNVDKFTMKYIAEASQQQVALETGEVDAFIAITQSLISALDPDTFVNYGVPSIAATCLNFSGDPSRVVANDINLRKAIAYAIDVNALIIGAYGGYADAMHAPESDKAVGFQESWKEQEYYEYNVEKAKEYLAQSNYQGETLELLASASDINNKLGVLIQAYLAEVGINLKLNIVDRALYTASSNDGSAFDVVIGSNGDMNLASYWLSCYDITAYPHGDSRGRNDTVLYDMIKNAWTNAGFTAENINAIHEYLAENILDYGLVQPYQCDMYNKQKLNITKLAYLLGGAIDFISCEYEQ